MNSHVGPYSFVQKLFGDPDDYAYKLDNDTFADALPIYMNWLIYQRYGFFHSVSIDYGTHRVYYSTSYTDGLMHGLHVYPNSTTGYFYLNVPETDQVTFVDEQIIPLLFESFFCD